MTMLGVGRAVGQALTSSRLARLVLASLLSVGFLLPMPARTLAAGERLCFEETGYCATNAFLVFWRAHGGVAILGFPISQPFLDDEGRVVQYYERAILEWHPQNPPAQRVQLALLGAARLGDRPERTAPPDPCGAGCTTFDATGHTLRGAFARFWSAHGGLPVFGYPISEVFTEVSPTDGLTYQVQYFERNRFEHHADQAGTPHEVQLGLLGAEALQARPDLLSRPAVPVPDYPLVEPGAPVRLVIPAIRVDAPVKPVGVDADGAMTAPSGAWDTTWYAPGARPGQPGNAVIAGHVDFRGVGPAVFWSLRALQPGAEVWAIDDRGARRRFVVQQVETYLANEAPLERIFGASDTANLNLISCAGNFDPVSRSYNQRIVVYTRWDGQPPR